MAIQETRVKGVQRLNNSKNGNPKYRFHTDDGVVTTPSDAMFVYWLNVDSFYNKDVVIDYHLTTKGKAILDSITLKEG